MSTYLAGFSLGLSLILAIGSQNAFVLKQGLKKRHVFIVCLVCALSDAILISLGVAGFGTVVKTVSHHRDSRPIRRGGLFEHLCSAEF